MYIYNLEQKIGISQIMNKAIFQFDTCILYSKNVQSKD